MEKTEEKQLLKELIEKALDKLYENDKYLLYHPNCTDDNTKHVSERGTVFRFGIYLQELINNDGTFSEYDLDSEYNRNIDDIKRGKYGKRVIPDLILHQRGTNKNLLVIEFKTWWNCNTENDKEKIKHFMSTKETSKQYFGYTHGLVVTLKKPTKDNEKDYKLEWGPFKPLI